MKGKPFFNNADDLINEPLKGVDDELTDLRNVVNFKFKHLDHQRKLKTNAQRKKAHKKPK